jgi:cell division protein ZapA (FtsZ GTPase activity inhibitor)
MGQLAMSEQNASAQTKAVVRIFDHQYRIGSATADTGAIEKAAFLLDERMRQIAENMTRRVPLEVAILAAMEIADEVLRFRNKREQLLSEADERISRFTRKLEDETGGTVGGDGPNDGLGDGLADGLGDTSPKPRF